ncbi:MAG: tail fiber domain-containing protein, partial [Thermoanaerobaculia bacterium]
FEIQNNGTTQFRIRNTQIAQVFDFKVAPGGFVINRPGVAKANLIMDATGKLWLGSGGSSMEVLPTGDMTIAGTLTQNSDRAAKENFESVDPQEVLQKLVDLPIETWNYRDNSEGVRHMGPMAQDFRAAFGLGHTDTGISVVDLDGVALAAIKGLAGKLDAKEQQLAALEQQNLEMAELLERVSAQVSALSTGR